MKFALKHIRYFFSVGKNHKFFLSQSLHVPKFLKMPLQWWQLLLQQDCISPQSCCNRSCHHCYSKSTQKTTVHCSKGCPASWLLVPIPKMMQLTSQITLDDAAMLGSLTHVPDIFQCLLLWSAKHCSYLSRLNLVY